MTYATQQDLIDRFGETELLQLTDRQNMPPSVIDAVVVGRALNDADGLINSYLGKVYRMPLSVVPTVLVKRASDIARYHLHGEAAPKDGDVYRNYRDAVDWLKDVAKGLVTIDAEGVTPAASGGGSVKASAPGRVFTRDTMRGY